VNTTWLAAAAAMGFFGGTHCVVMCGGIAGVLSGGLVELRTKQGAARARWREAGLTLAYNAGRIATYSALGALLGVLGGSIERFPALRDAGLAMRVLAGLTLVGLGAHLAGWFPHFARLERVGLPLWQRVAPITKRLLPAQTVPAAVGLGLAWGLMPCGLVYSALAIAAVSESAPAGALAMAAFGLGTLPALLAAGAAGAQVGVLLRNAWVRRTAGVLVAVAGLMHVAGSARQWHTLREAAPAACCQGAQAAD